MSYERELDAVQRWLLTTDAIALEHLYAGVRTEEKADGTPVTEADRRIEQALRDSIETEFPGDGIVGEEYGEESSSARRWIIDPIDGTKNYSRGVPIFATLVALEEDGRLVVGVASAPALRTRWWATRGGGAFRDNTPIRVSGVNELAQAEIVSGDAFRYARPVGRFDAFLSVCDRARRFRGFGDFWGHMLVAQGSAEAMVEFPVLQVWDLAAPKIIVEEAGGRMTSLEGEDRFDAGDALTTNGAVHDEILAVLREHS